MNKNDKRKIIQLEESAKRVRNKMISAVTKNGGHLSSSLGAVELCVVLNSLFDAKKDRIIFDVGHQGYAHKIINGANLDNLRKKGGESGFSMPSVNKFDAHNGAHSGSSIGVALGYAYARDHEQIKHEQSEKNQNQNENNENQDNSKLNNENQDRSELIQDRTNQNEINGNQDRSELNQDKNRLKQIDKDTKIVCVIGDASITNGVSLEGINLAGEYNGQLIIVINDNGMSIGKNVGVANRVFSSLTFRKSYRTTKSLVARLMSKTVLTRGVYSILRGVKRLAKRILWGSNLFDQLGFKYIYVKDGHDIKKLYKAVSVAKELQAPVVLHVKTVKGKGLSEAEKNPTKYHSLKAESQVDGESYASYIEKNIERILEENSEAYAITASMAEGTGLKELKRKNHERFIDVGIAEELAVTTAVGLARGGKKPIVFVYSTFLQRAFDEIAIDVAIDELPVVFMIDHAGLVGSDGKTHQGVMDISYMTAIPNMTVLAPSSKEEMIEMLKFAIDQDKPIAIRYPSSAQNYEVNNNKKTEISSIIYKDKEESKEKEESKNLVKEEQEEVLSIIYKDKEESKEKEESKNLVKEEQEEVLSIIYKDKEESKEKEEQEQVLSIIYKDKEVENLDIVQSKNKSQEKAGDRQNYMQYEVQAEGDGAVVLAVGERMLNVAKSVKKKRRDICVVSARVLKPLDEEFLNKVKDRKLIVMEENVIEGGLASSIAVKTGKTVKAMTVNGFTAQATIKEQLKMNDLTEERLLNLVDERD